MTECRHIIVLLLFAGLLPAAAKAVQSSDSKGAETKSGQPNLELTAHGEVRMLAGRRGIFRVYTAPDGTEGSFTAGRFLSLNDAKRQIVAWVKIADTVTSRDQKKDERGRVIGVRIAAIAQVPNSNVKEFVIIMRIGLDCYLIHSVSLPVAMRLENMLEED